MASTSRNSPAEEQAEVELLPPDAQGARPRDGHSSAGTDDEDDAMNVDTAGFALPSATPLRDVVQAFFCLGFRALASSPAHLPHFLHEFVHIRGWLSKRAFLQVVAFTQAIPGPSSLQIALMLGWLHGRFLAGLVAVLLFVVPAALSTLLLGMGVRYISGDTRGGVPPDWYYEVSAGLVPAGVGQLLATCFPGTMRGGSDSVRHGLSFFSASCVVLIHNTWSPVAWAFPLLLTFGALFALFDSSCNTDCPEGRYPSLRQSGSSSALLSPGAPSPILTRPPLDATAFGSASLPFSSPFDASSGLPTTSSGPPAAPSSTQNADCSSSLGCDKYSAPHIALDGETRAGTSPNVPVATPSTFFRRIALSRGLSALLLALWLMGQLACSYRWPGLSRSAPEVDLFQLSYCTGSYSIGGELTVLPLLFVELVRSKLIFPLDFFVGLALVQCVQGSFSTIAVFLGAVYIGWQGAAIAFLGLLLPSFLLLFGGLAFWDTASRSKALGAVLAGFDAVAVGLVAGAGAMFAVEVAPTPGPLSVLVASLAMASLTKLPPVLIIAAGAFFGWLLFRGNVGGPYCWVPAYIEYFPDYTDLCKDWLEYTRVKNALP